MKAFIMFLREPPLSCFRAGLLSTILPALPDRRIPSRF